MREVKRIVSLLPSATEMIYELGLQDRLVGVSHECDYPEEVRGKPVVVRSALDLSSLSPREIDATVSAAIREGREIYTIDEQLLENLSPDLVIGQGLCDVCAVGAGTITGIISRLSSEPELLDMSPSTIGGILGNIMELGRHTGREERAREVVSALQTRISAVHRKTRGMSERRSVFFMEWTDPIFCSGHWVPQMIEIAGGTDLLGRKGKPSVRIKWETVAALNPEIIIISSCGMHLPEMLSEAERLSSLPGWSEVKAVRDGNVFAVDAGAYFARPGPRVVSGIELMAHILHPEVFEWNGPSDAFARLDGAKLLV